MIRHTIVLALLAPTLAVAQTAVVAQNHRNGESDKVVPPAERIYAPAIAIPVRQPPVLDGRTDDPIWQDARVIDQFLEFQPTEGADTRFKTEIRVAYDQDYLYILGRMHDPAPDSIVALLSRRDVRTESEWLKVIIDGYQDKRTAFQFIVNPVGVKRDYYVYNEWNEDDSWDGIWDVATAIDSLGWVAEIRIPWSQLRFANKDEHTFGLMVWRDIARTGQRISWPFYSRNRPGYISQAGELTGLRGLPTSRRLEVIPYAVTSNKSEADGDGFARKQTLSAGADLKYGLTSNLTVDATINPDFGQVEADPAVLNLSAFETFQQERRPFFLEGTGIFSFNLNCNDGSCSGLFYSRRIGRYPQLRDDYGDAATPTNTTILGAAKLTGRLQGGYNVGVLSAVTQQEEGAAGQTVEPLTHYFVGRMQREMNEGRSGIGAMVTSVNRANDDLTENFLRENAFTGGLDGRHRFGPGNNYEVSGFAAASHVTGDADAIARTQMSSVHYYQRPDDNIEFDPTRTSLSGAAGKIGINKVGGGITRFEFGYRNISPGFEANDVGFLNRADVQSAWGWVGFQFNQPTSWYRMAFHNLNAWWGGTHSGHTNQDGGNINSHVQLRNFHWLHAGVNVGSIFPTMDDRASFGGPAKRQSPYLTMWAGWEGDSRKRIVPNLWYNWGKGQEGRWGFYGIDPGVLLNLGSRYQVRLAGGYFEERDYELFYDRLGDATSDTAHYLFATTRQQVTSVSTRVDVTLTPNLTLQAYARPFIAVVDFDDVHELTNPHAEKAVDRYSPYPAIQDGGGFRSVSFQSNTVLRWEYRPGSTLFLVWSQNRGEYAEFADPDLRFQEDYGNVFKKRPDNTFLIKMSYWFNP